MITPPDFKIIIDVMEGHAKEICPSVYTDESSEPARHCLLGWLALDAGIAPPLARYNGHVIGMAGTKRFALEMGKKYGLCLRQLRQLQFANDDAKGSDELIELVTNLLKDWSEHQRLAA